MTGKEPQRRLSTYTIGLIITSAVVLVIAGVALIKVLPENMSRSNVQLGNGTFTVRIAKTVQERDMGLSGIAHLNSNQALLMIFPSEAKWGIWMKDMKIPLDIVWLNQTKQVTYIVEDALPKDSTNIIFTPYQSSLYVIELTAGSVQKESIKVGQTATFDTITQGVS
jgi:uncharacterized membrane protein (UPF0127 family)